MTVRPSWKDVLPREGLSSPERTVADAFARIGLTDDGRVVAEWLVNHRLHAVPPAGLDDGALRDFYANQRVALTFLRLLTGQVYERRDPDGRDGKRGPRSTGG